MTLSSFIKSGLALAAFLTSAGCAAIMPRATKLDERIHSFAFRDAPLLAPVTVRWNAHMIPHIAAATDQDLAFVLGMVHAHLRGGQVQFLKRIAYGRLSELIGSFAAEIDHTIRIIGFARAAKKAEENLPPQTRAFAQAFADGFNYYQRRRPLPPAEAGVFMLDAEPLSVQDMLAIGRLAGTDVNWFSYFSILAAYGQPHLQEAWRRVLVAGSGVTLQGTDQQAFVDILAGLSKSGSNSIAVSARRSATGGALMASDPHLGITLPNLWLLASLRSPSYQAAGLMIPGLPFIALGRSPWMAWGGTNLRGYSSDLYDVGELPADFFREEKTVIKVRWGDHLNRIIRHTPYGAVLNDSLLFKGQKKRPIALRWVGQEGSDEITAMLGVMRARTPQDFRAALSSFGVSAQTMLFADHQGNAGLAIAAQIPERRGVPHSPVLVASDLMAQWGPLRNSMDLPFIMNPSNGFVASANNKPPDADIPLGYAFSPSERLERIEEFLDHKDRVTTADLVALQQDTLSLAARDLARVFATKIKELRLSQDLSDFEEIFSGWDGCYDAESKSPVLFEIFLYHLLSALHDAGRLGPLSAFERSWGHLLAFLPDQLDRLNDEYLRAIFLNAATAARRDAAAHRNWGDMHRLVVGPLISRLPVIGSLFALADLPVGGSRETPMKTSHELVRGRHAVVYGSQARHIADMADPDANDFVLLGGNDGLPGSPAFLDQVLLWRTGRMIRLPLSDAGVTAAYPILQVINTDKP